MPSPKRDVSVKVTSSHCQRCRGSRSHVLLATATDDDDPDCPITFTTTMDLLKCQGCGSVSARRDDYCSEPSLVYPEEGWGKHLDDSNGRHEITYWPGIEQRALPDWLGEIEDPLLKDTLTETYDAFNMGLLILAAAGTRTVLDLLANKLLGRDAGSFAQKLEALYREGHISANQKDTIGAVVDAGSAAQHRAHRVTHYDLKLILVILESLIHQTVLANAKAASLRKRTPQRMKVDRVK